MWIERNNKHFRAGRSLRGAAAALAGLLALGGCGGDAGQADTRPVGAVLDRSFHGHQLRDVPGDEAPTVTVTATADAHGGGWNVRLRTKRFRFTPRRVNDEPRGGQGHAHLYVAGKKYARLYSPWFHLPADAVPAGKQQLLVTLNANDHTVWATGGEPVTATVTVTGKPGHSHGTGHGHSHGHGD